MNGKLDEHGDFETEEIDLTLATHKIDWFVELCERYSLPSSGTKTVRRDRLVKFSEAGMAKWKSTLFTPTRIPHKGVRNGGVTKRKPPKRVHRILQAGLHTTTAPPVIFATERSKDTRSQMVVDRILPWAHSLLEKMVQETAATTLRHTHLPERKASGIYAGVRQMDPFENPGFARRITSIVEERLAVYQGSPVTDAVMESSPPSLSESPHSSMDLDTTHFSLTAASTNTIPTDVDHSDSPILPLSEPPQAMSDASERRPVMSYDKVSPRALQCTLTFADGVRLAICKNEVPPTQPFSYNTDLQRLIQSWDDCSADWAPPPDHPIVIHGRPIPIKHWGELYRFNKMANGEWKRLKSHWSNWQFFMQAYQASSTPEAFWDTFSDSDGRRLNFSTITKILKEKRQQEDNNIATEAKRVFDKEFTNQFGYEKEGRWVGMTRHSDIAKTYRKKIRVEAEGA
ncbi:hypothetical protein IW261DRAFT_1562663 [Armillaria novae-zelandiae]|uniref:SAP domain-containing protein n=1 Tax=Armillaria novae-zelandiae TaxID=153914 RepID=A0AA39PBW7_9AGAR|nr:hypothetical protein IW261DRAFT_1562663 [Armillaria novae-zelandiae]